MTLELRRLRPCDLPWIKPHPGQPGLARDLTPATAAGLEEAGPAYAFYRGWRPVAALGLIETMGPPPIAWAVLSLEVGRDLLHLTRYVGRFLGTFEAVETGVAWGYRDGERWARLLGFTATGRGVSRWDASQPMQVWHWRKGL